MVRDQMRLGFPPSEKQKTWMPLKWLFILANVFFCMSCQQVSQRPSTGTDGLRALNTDIMEPNTRQMVLRKGEAAVRPFKENLQKVLLEKVSTEGPLNTMKYCKDEAQELTRGYQGLITQVGRTSDRIRSPLNAPEPWMEDLMQNYKGTRASSPGPAQVVQLSDEGVYGYVEPIYIKPMCLHCHGSQISAPILEELNLKYLQDQARDYKTGEFRGVFWSRIDLSQWNRK